MDFGDPHLFRPDRARLWEAIVAKIEADPSLLDLPLDNIRRWLAHGRLHPVPLLEWRERLKRARESAAGMEELLSLLRSESSEAERLKSCSPFPGVLTAGEIARCGVPAA